MQRCQTDTPPFPVDLDGITIRALEATEVVAYLEPGPTLNAVLRKGASVLADRGLTLKDLSNAIEAARERTTGEN